MNEEKNVILVQILEILIQIFMKNHANINKVDKFLER